MAQQPQPQHWAPKRRVHEQQQLQTVPAAPAAAAAAPSVSAPPHIWQRSRAPPVPTHAQQPAWTKQPQTQAPHPHASSHAHRHPQQHPHSHAAHAQPAQQQPQQPPQDNNAKRRKLPHFLNPQFVAEEAAAENQSHDSTSSSSSSALTPNIHAMDVSAPQSHQPHVLQQPVANVWTRTPSAPMVQQQQPQHQHSQHHPQQSHHGFHRSVSSFPAGATPEVGLPNPQPAAGYSTQDLQLANMHYAAHQQHQQQQQQQHMQQQHQPWQQHAHQSAWTGQHQQQHQQQHQPQWASTNNIWASRMQQQQQQQHRAFHSSASQSQQQQHSHSAAGATQPAKHAAYLAPPAFIDLPSVYSVHYANTRARAMELSTELLSILRLSLDESDAPGSTQALGVPSSQRAPVAIGFDLEWRPNFVAGQAQNPVALMQIALADRAYLFQLIHWAAPPRRSGASASKHTKDHLAALAFESLCAPLASILCDARILKVGVGIKGDVSKFHADYAVRIEGALDLSDFANERNGTRKEQQQQQQAAKEKKMRASNKSASETSAAPAAPAAATTDATPASAALSSSSPVVVAIESDSSAASASPPPAAASVDAAAAAASSSADGVTAAAAPSVTVAAPSAVPVSYPHRVWSLSGLVSHCFPGQELAKPKRIRMSNWEKRPLDPKQVQYAALDAYVSWACWDTLQKQHAQAGTTAHALEVGLGRRRAKTPELMPVEVAVKPAKPTSTIVPIIAAAASSSSSAAAATASASASPPLDLTISPVPAADSSDEDHDVEFLGTAPPMRSAAAAAAAAVAASVAVTETQQPAVVIPPAVVPAVADATDVAAAAASSAAADAAAFAAASSAASTPPLVDLLPYARSECKRERRDQIIVE